MSVMVPEPELDDLYRDITLDHYRQPRNHGTLEKADETSEGYNPLCGDEVTLQLIFENGKVKQAMFQGKGCSISQASSSMLTEVIIGKTIEELKRLISQFKGMMIQNEPPTPEMGDLEALEGVQKFPVRIKCATLVWNVLEEIVQSVESKA